jgi:hypothetical protein
LPIRSDSTASKFSPSGTSHAFRSSPKNRGGPVLATTNLKQQRTPIIGIYLAKGLSNSTPVLHDSMKSNSCLLENQSCSENQKAGYIR